MYKFIFHSLLIILYSNFSYAQSDTTVLDDIVFSANKFVDSSRYISQNGFVLNAEILNKSVANNTAALLEGSGKVFVQKSQLGGGSPILRGFEASRVLLIVDGVRLNNAIYRSGHLQNILTVDNDILERMEVYWGPSSTIFGSDAIGGTISLKTRDPQFSNDVSKNFISLNASTTYSTAYSEKSIHADFNIGGIKLASLTSISVSDFGDLRQGNIRNPFYADFGKRTFYVERINGIDSVMSNPDVNIQKQSAYKQFDLLQKIIFRPNNKIKHLINIQWSTTSNIPRYDRLTEVRNGLPRFAEWYYGPQDRSLFNYQFSFKSDGKFFDEMLVNTAFQKNQESRMQRSLYSDYKQNRIEDINVFSYSIDFKKKYKQQSFQYGLDGQLNFLKSTAYNKNIITSEELYNLDARYPDGINRMGYYGIYLQHTWKSKNNKLIINDGLRINYHNLYSTFIDTSILRLPFNDASLQNFTYSFNLGLVYLPNQHNKLSTNISTGFRMPNIDDLAKVFESAGGEQLIVPNSKLKPEQSINIDIAWKYQRYNVLTMELVGFYTLLRDAIVLDKFSFNGASSVMYDGIMTPIVANQNKARANVFGASIFASIIPTFNTEIYANLSFTRGDYITHFTAAPLDHIPPTYGKLGVRYNNKSYGIDLYTIFNDWKHLHRYNPFGEDNIQYATIHGMPAWFTMNLSAKYQLLSKLSVHIALENIFDRNYRTFASGISAPGRNLILKLKYNYN